MKAGLVGSGLFFGGIATFVLEQYRPRDNLNLSAAASAILLAAALFVMFSKK
jgi:hypothetical protein